MEVFDLTDFIFSLPRIINFGSTPYIQFNDPLIETMDILLDNKNLNKYSIHLKSNRSPPLIEKAVDDLLEVGYIKKTGERPSKTNEKKNIDVYSLSKNGVSALMSYRKTIDKQKKTLYIKKQTIDKQKKPIDKKKKIIGLPQIIRFLRVNYPEYILSPFSGLHDSYFILLYPYLDLMKDIDYDNLDLDNSIRYIQVFNELNKIKESQPQITRFKIKNGVDEVNLVITDNDVNIIKQQMHKIKKSCKDKIYEYNKILEM